MDRPITTLFMLMSVDGKISTGASDNLDVDKDFPKIAGVKEGLHQYYEIEQTTDLWSLNSGRVQAKIGVNTKDMPNKTPVSFAVIDNKHLNENGIRYFCALSKQFVLVTSNENHPAFKIEEDNLHIIYQNKLSLRDVFTKLKSEYGCERITIQTGGTLLELFLDKENIKSIIRIISLKLEEITDFPGIIDEDDISEEEISEIEKWVEFKCEDALRKMNIANLPDSIGYGEDIEILGIDGQKLFLKIDEININPSAGDKEWIDINLSDEKEIIASGIVELTVGYIEYDEDGGVADGLADEIDYSYHSIIEQLDNFILEQNEYMKTEKTILEILEEAIE